jgi:hypothetical protein
MEGELDARSSLIQSGELKFNNDRSIDKESAAVKDGRVLVKKDGSLDFRCSAAVNDQLYLKPSVEGEERRNFTQTEKDNAWDKAEKIPGCNPDVYRLDKSGSIFIPRH